MIKVAIIGGEDAVTLGIVINDFIKDKKVMDIKYQAILLPKEYRGNIPTRTSVLDRALIIYEEEGHETV